MVFLLFIAVCFLSFANGANDNFKGVASLYGSGVANYRVALFWATLTTLIGSLCALYLAQTLLVKFSGKGLVSDTLIQSVPFITAVAAGAGLTVILATRFGFPVSTTHALLGAMVGSGLLATWGEINLAALQNNFILPLLLSPVTAVLVSIIIYLALKKVQRQFNVSQALCVCLENDVLLNKASTHGAAVEYTRQGLTVGNDAACENRYSEKIMGINTQSVLDKLHFLSAGSVCFARGMNDTPKIAALLLLFPSLPVSWLIVLVATIMALGGLIHSRRVAETMSLKITQISHGQGLAANMTTALLVIFASRFGMPVSTTHVSVGSLFGIGLSNGKTNFRMIGTIILSWVLTLPCAALCAAGIYKVIVT
jgi:inorganic phosphate transporter, PiT family